MEKLSRLLSVIFHPVFAIFSGVLILCYVPSEPLLSLQDSVFHMDQDYKKNLLILYGTFTVLFPITAILTLYSTRAVKSIELKDRKDRFIPVALTLVIHLVLYYFLRQGDVPQVLLSSIIGMSISFFIFLIINISYQISLHGMGSGMIFGLIFTYYKMQQSFSIIPLIIITILVGIIGWARIRQKAHTPMEYFTGVLLGAVPQFICIYFEFNI